MSRPRIAQTDDQIGFYWLSPVGEPIGLADLVLLDDEPDRLVPTHLEALDDALIAAAHRFGDRLGGGRGPLVGTERDDVRALNHTLERLNHEYASALVRTGLPVEIRSGLIIGTSALIAIHARMALGTAGPTPLAGQLADPRLGVVAGLGQFHQVSADQPWRGGRWVVQADDGSRYPLTLSMLLFDSSGVNKDAALQEHRQALSSLTTPDVADGLNPEETMVMAGAVEWLLFDWLTAHRESAESAAIEIRNERIEDAAMIVSAAAAVARLHATVDPTILDLGSA
jgi:hypothetical protein